MDLDIAANPISCFLTAPPNMPIKIILHQLHHLPVGQSLPWILSLFDVADWNMANRHGHSQFWADCLIWQLTTVKA